MKICVVGYGSQARAQAQNMRDSGMDVIIGQRPGKSFEMAKEEKFEVMPVSDAVKISDIIYILLPDEVQKEVYEKEIKDNLKGALCFSHGFNIVFKQIIPPKDVDVIMVAPRSNGKEVRDSYLQNKKIPAMLCVHQDFSRKAKEKAKQIVDANKFIPYECTFEQETYEDLFSEQNILCGGLIELIKKSSEVLIEAGYPEEMAYFGAIYELKHVINLINEKGLAKFNEIISNTAEYGEYTVGPKIIDDSVKQKMKESLNRIESGEFTKEYLEEAKKNFPTIKKMRDLLAKHPIEKARNKVKS